MRRRVPVPHFLWVAKPIPSSPTRFDHSLVTSSTNHNSVFVAHGWRKININYPHVSHCSIFGTNLLLRRDCASADLVRLDMNGTSSRLHFSCDPKRGWCTKNHKVAG